MYAVVETGGKQYLVREGDTVSVEKLNDEGVGSVDFSVIAVGEGKDIKIGTPVVEGAKVSGTIVGNVKADKITVFKMKAKKRTRTKQGHRQKYTEVKIDKIAA